MTGKPKLQLTTGPETVRRLRQAILDGALPNTYVTDGRLVHIERVSGRGPVSLSGEKDSPLPVMSSLSTPDLLANWFSENAHVFKVMSDGREVESFPNDNVLKKTLAVRNWPNVPVLKGIIGAPVLRPDGTLLQDDGYDAATGLYLEKKVQIPRVPDRPTSGQVDAAKTFIVETLLGDFPWKDAKSDRANYIAALVTQILRPYLKCLVPLIFITATTPSSGKTILTSASGMLYGQRFLPWPYSDEELSKTITSVLTEPAGVIIFDNVEEGTVIDSPILAGLLTAEEWSARILGQSKSSTFANDRIWVITGNNLQVGGDMASRVIMVRLDPDMPNPENRTGFAIPNLTQKILEHEFQGQILWSLLVLVADWVNAGRKVKRGPTMRQFTPWLEAVGGFLDHHGIPGLFENHADVQAINEGDEVWHDFLSTWHRLYGDKKFKVADLRRTTQSDFSGAQDRTDDHVWNGAFLKTAAGRIPNLQKLGLLLKGRAGRWHGEYVLRRVFDSHTKAGTYFVEKRNAYANAPE